MKSSQSGQTIIEILVAASIVSVLLVSLLILGTNSLKSTTYARNLNQATEFSNQASEWLKNRKQEMGWSAFITTLQEDTSDNSVTYCLDSLPGDQSGFVSLINQDCTDEELIAQTIFTRQMELDISDVSNGILSATISTTWQDNVTRSATVYITLTQWQ